jgi:histidyl-tRNA synthetase
MSSTICCQNHITGIINLDASDGYILKLSEILRSQGFYIQILNNKKFQDNLKFIINNNIYKKQVVIVGLNEEQQNKYIIKDLQLGTQEIFSLK